MTDRVDEAMIARTRERYSVEHRRLRRRVRRARRSGELPNLIVIGGLKCGTTSLHQYLDLHPQIGMSRPKELSFFVEEITWDLGPDWYASHFPRSARVRGESSPHYTNRPRFEGVPQRMRSVLGDDVRLIYMVRDPIERMLSHYLHTRRGGYEDRPLYEALAGDPGAYLDRSRYAFQLEPYLETFDREQLLIVSNEELDRDRYRTMRRVFGFVGVDERFRSEQFERRWWVGSAEPGHLRLMDRAVRLPGLRELDRSFDRWPGSLRWLVERTVHPPASAAAPKPELPEDLRARFGEILAPEVAKLETIAGRSFGWQL